MKWYCYRVRRQKEFLDDTSTVKRSTTYSSDCRLNIGGLYQLTLNCKPVFYRIEALKWEYDSAKLCVTKY